MRRERFVLMDHLSVTRMVRGLQKSADGFEGNDDAGIVPVLTHGGLTGVAELDGAGDGRGGQGKSECRDHTQAKACATQASRDMRSPGHSADSNANQPQYIEYASESSQNS